MPSRVLILTLMCLAFHCVPFLTTSKAQEAAHTVRLDKSVYLPEVRLTRAVNPVTTFLFVSAHESKGGAGSLKKPLCAIDTKNNEIHIKSPEHLIEGSRTRVLTRNNVDTYLDTISCGPKQTACVAFTVTSARRQSAIVQVNTDSSAALFSNGKFVCNVRGADTKASGGIGYLPVTLERGANTIIVRQNFAHEKPHVELAVSLDHSHDLAAAWQARGGLLKKLLYMPAEHADIPALEWDRNLGDFSPALEVRDVSTNKIVLQRESARQGRIIEDENADLSPGVYEATYRTRAGDESASELFLVGYPDDLLAKLQDALSHYNPDLESQLAIEAQLRRARILLAKKHYSPFDRKWQEKAVWSFASLATMVHRLNGGTVNLTKNQPGLHIRGFVSGIDDSLQFYRLYIPANHNPGSPLPLLVIPSTRVQNSRPFIEGPVIANQRAALRWVAAAERHGFALLWSGYRGFPDGSTSESIHINEAIQAVEKCYLIDKQRIGIYATCSAGYNAGRLISEYPNRFSAIVYDRAVFDHDLPTGKSSPSLEEWYETINPGRHVLENRNLNIFVMHDNTTPPGHGPMKLTTEFLEHAKEAGRDITSHLSKEPMTRAARMDMVFSWLASCRNYNPDNTRARLLDTAGYTGPISEIFTTPFIVVVGTRTLGNDMQKTADALARDYTKYFHGAECVVKKDTEVTQDDINNNSLILIGNPTGNSVWENLEPRLPVKVTSKEALYNNQKLAGNKSFQVIVKHPYADGKYVLLLGAGDTKFLKQNATRNLFAAWYDCILTSPVKIIGKLDSYVDTKTDNNGNNGNNGNKTPNPKSLGPQNKK